ncbi:alanyl-tRNA editing protein [Herbiconiux daphne]|uniref:Metal-dependent hydrolase n=1 Tax=Herbiconiux daphne TaxID=2970914 RepID=A0ABT2H488_9MICO|nr:metal-dependent hydrolase [Herbiconiux daphne]MCS5734751.1 metal-dependent hydrolase [Herbiconiux daphne]
MTLPRVDTVVTYPAGAVSSTGRVLHVEPLGDGRAAVLLDETAFHPVDAAWPDQGADRGVLVVGVDGGDGDGGGGIRPAAALDVVDCVVGATDGETLFLGADIPVRKGTDGWAFVVAHIVETGDATGGTTPADGVTDAAPGPLLVEGAAVRTEVDPRLRRALSAGHTACHLASLALNEALATAWTKDVPLDARGNPNFDAIAIESSTIEPFGSTDVYRVGKSLRKKGFAPAALTDDLGAVEARVNDLLAQWRASGAPVGIDREGDGLTSRRTWTCALPDSTVAIACGGTHVESLGEFATLGVELATNELPGALELRMVTWATMSEGG